jgi:hypothetical protein
MEGLRGVVITGPPSLPILDVTGPLEMFSQVPGYEVILGSPDGDDVLRANRGISLTGARSLSTLDMPIDTQVAGGPSAEK